MIIILLRARGEQLVHHWLRVGPRREWDPHGGDSVHCGAVGLGAPPGGCDLAVRAYLPPPPAASGWTNGAHLSLTQRERERGGERLNGNLDPSRRSARVPPLSPGLSLL